MTYQTVCFVVMALIRVHKGPFLNFRHTKLEDMFSRLAGTDGGIQPWELQDMLTSALSTGKVGYDNFWCT